jgi:hypothetical protein
MKLDFIAMFNILKMIYYFNIFMVNCGILKSK